MAAFQESANEEPARSEGNLQFTFENKLPELRGTCQTYREPANSNYVLISLSLKSNYDVIIFTVVSYFPCLLLGDLKLAELGSTNENSAPPDGTKLKNSIKIIE